MKRPVIYYPMLDQLYCKLRQNFKKQIIFNSPDAWQSQIINLVNPFLHKSPSPIMSKNSLGQDSNTSNSLLLYKVGEDRKKNRKNHHYILILLNSVNNWGVCDYITLNITEYFQNYWTYILMLLKRPYWLSAELQAKCALTKTLLTDTTLTCFAILLHFPTQSFKTCSGSITVHVILLCTALFKTFCRFLMVFRLEQFHRCSTMFYFFFCSPFLLVTF